MSEENMAALVAAADDQALLREVVAFYERRLKESPDALAWLKAHAIDGPGSSSRSTSGSRTGRWGWRGDGYLGARRGRERSTGPCERAPRRRGGQASLAGKRRVRGRSMMRVA